MEKFIQDDIRWRIFDIIRNQYISVDEQADRLIKFFSLFKNKSTGDMCAGFPQYYKRDIVPKIYETIRKSDWIEVCKIWDKDIDTISLIVLQEYARIVSDTVIARYTPVVRTEQTPKKKKFLFFFKK